MKHLGLGLMLLLACGLVVRDAWQTDVLNGIVTTILASLMLVAYVLAWKWAS